jgi:hypothetical protein
VTSNEGGSGGTGSASVTVTPVTPPPSGPTTIPTLQEWALFVLCLMLLVAGGVALRRRGGE